MGTPMAYQLLRLGLQFEEVSDAHGVLRMYDAVWTTGRESQEGYRYWFCVILGLFGTDPGIAPHVKDTPHLSFAFVPKIAGF
jgi:hypothetical protein